MTGVCCYTNFTYAYAGRALTLLETVRSAHPDWAVCAMVVDEPPPGLDPGLLAGFDRVMRLTELGIPRLRAWLFKHDVIEACTAVKGAAMLRLMEAGFDTVVYLDPDIAVFAPLTPVLDALEHASIVLTPHQVSPNANLAVARDNELMALRFGVYNLGFIAVRNDPVGQGFAKWWSVQLLRACYDDAAAGLFTDQKYVDLVPALFDRVAIVRDAGCNVASWNLSARPVVIGRDGRITAGGALLRFYHFTKIGSVGDVMTDRYSGDRLDVAEIWAWYGRRIACHQPDGAAAWAYGAWNDGPPVPYAVRVLYRDSREHLAAYDDPFDAAGPFRTWLMQNQPALLATPSTSAAA